MAAKMAQQARLDAQTMAAVGHGGLARSPHPPVYAASDQDTLANLQPGGETVLSPLSSMVRRTFQAGFPRDGAAYLKAIAGDGQGGFNVTWTIDGVEFPAHFAADAFDGDVFHTDEDGYYSLYGFTDAFYAEPEDPAAVDRTDGSSEFDYLDLMGWNLIIDGIGLTGFSTIGARTMPDNLPMGNATYEGSLYAQWWESDNPDFGKGGGQYLQGNLKLEANLQDVVLSGQIDGIYIPWWSSASGQDEPLKESSIAIQSTGIGEAEFIAPWVGSGPMNDTPHDKTLHGFQGTVLGASQAG